MKDEKVPHPTSTRVLRTKRPSIHQISCMTKHLIKRYKHSASIYIIAYNMADIYYTIWLSGHSAKMCKTWSELQDKYFWYMRGEK